MGLFGNIFGHIKLPFGLDIGYTSVRAVQLAKRGKLVHLAGYGEAPLGKDVFSHDKVDTEALSLAIKDVLTNSKIKPIVSKQVVCALPESDIFVKVMQFPKMEDSELEEVIKLETEKIVPFSISELYLDWERVKTGGEEENDKDNILVVAAPQKLIHSYLDAVKKVGLEVISMEIEPAAVCRALIKRGQGKNDAILIVDIGADTTSITIYDFESIQLTGSTHIAGNTFTESLSKYLKLDFDRTEEIKRDVINSGKDLNEKLFNSALKPVLLKLGNEISRSISYYNNFVRDSHPVSKIILCGGNAQIKGAPEFMEKMFKIKCEIGNPWTNVTAYPLKAIPKMKASLYATAIGLALRELVE